MVSHHLSEQSDEALMVLIQSHHSQVALIEIHRRYSSKLLGYFFKMLHRNESLAQDFVQDLFLKILEKKHLFDTNRKFYTWVFTIASNMCKTEYRYFGKTVDFDSEKHSRIILEQDRTDKSYFLESLDKSLNEMEDVHKNILVLRYLEEFSLNEITEILEISLGTVKSRLFYATKKLTEELKEFDPSLQQNIFKLI